MTRGLNPPDTLSAEDVHTLRAVRRDIYYNGIIGGGLGLCSGIVLYTGAQWAKKLGVWKGGPKLNPNTGLLTILGSFAFGTFFMASTTGKEMVHLLHPVFRAGWAEPDHDLALPQVHLNYEGTRTQQLLQAQLRERRITRRKTLEETLVHGRGISDSHSGRWVDHEPSTISASTSSTTTSVVDPQQLRERRLVRRKSLTNTLVNGRGISDSHSGRWVEENSETKFEKG